jgi:hypothetical protein
LTITLLAFTTTLLGGNPELLGIDEFDPGLDAAIVAVADWVIENVAFVHSNRITRSLLLSATNKNTPGNSIE